MGLDAAAPGLEGAQFHPGADQHAAGALGAHEGLVAGEAKHADAGFARVDGQAARSLGGVKDEQQTLLPAKSGQPFDIQHIAGEVGSVGADQGPGIFPQQTGQSVVIHQTVPVRRQEGKLHAFFLQAVQGPQHAVVLQIGGYHVIARRKQAEDGRVQGLGGVGGKADPVRVVAAEKAAQLFPAVVDRACGGQRAFVSAPAHVAQRAQGVSHRPHHAIGPEQAGSRVIQIDHWGLPRIYSLIV